MADLIDPDDRERPLKPTHAESIAKVEAELRAVVAALARPARAAEAKTRSRRVIDEGTRDPLEIYRVVWAAAIAALIVWAICCTTLAVIGA